MSMDMLEHITPIVKDPLLTRPMSKPHHNLSLMRHSLVLDIKCLTYIHNRQKCAFDSVFQKLKCHHIEVLQRIEEDAEQGVTSEGMYLYLCKMMKRHIEWFEKIDQDVTTEGLWRHCGPSAAHPPNATRRSKKGSTIKKGGTIKKGNTIKNNPHTSHKHRSHRKSNKRNRSKKHNSGPSRQHGESGKVLQQEGSSEKNG